MAIPDLLVSRHTVTGGAVFNLTGGITLSQIGSTFTANLETNAADQSYGDASVIEFNGSRYVWHRNIIREENTGGAGLWGSVNTIANMSATNNFAGRSGLHSLEKDGDNILVGLYQTNANIIAATRSTDGATWTSFTALSDFNGNRRRGRSIVFRNKLYWYASNTNEGAVRYDPQTDSATFIEFEDLVANNANIDFCVFGNDLFAAGSSAVTTTETMKLWRLNGNQFDRIFSFTADNGTFGENGGCALFTDNTNLYVIFPGRDGADVVGNTAWRINTPNGTPTATDLTNIVLPAQFRPGGGSTTDDNRWHVYMNNTAPGSLEIFLWRIPDPQTGTHEAFQWQGDASVMTSLGASDVNLTESIYFPNTKLGGGERIDASGKIYGELEQQTVLDATSGEITLSYRVFGSGANQTLTLYYTNNEQIPATQATLTAATGGSSSLSGNTIINVSPDSGATLYTLTWDAATDGVGTDDNPKLMIDLN